MNNVNTAMQMTDEIKDIARQSLKEYQNNMNETEKLLANSSEINQLSQDY